EALSDTLRPELRGTGIHVCLVEPGPISSRFRENAYQAYLRNIDRANSVHSDYYTRVEARLGGTKPLPFTLTPEAVARKVEHALRTRHPKIRYPVTAPTRFLAAARRLLTGRALDRLATAIGGNGQR
ncbi:MAG: Rossmann-fold NAD(P)-binding domain-containing protein, partial [Acidiferrobacterales bacterium]